MCMCLRQALRQVSELCVNPAFGRSSSHRGLGSTGPPLELRGCGQEGTALAENQSWRMGHEERAVSTTHHGNTRSATVSPAGHKRDSEEGAGAVVLPTRGRRPSPTARCIPRKTLQAALSCPDLGWGLVGAPPYFQPGQKYADGLLSSGSAAQNSS